MHHLRGAVLQPRCARVGVAGARTEIPGCSLCMGNQARVEPGCNVVSTCRHATSPTASGRARTCTWRAPSSPPSRPSWASSSRPWTSKDEYMSYMAMAKVDATADNTYRYLNFDELPDFRRRERQGRDQRRDEGGEEAEHPT
ncbi:hypothetical protein THAOC_00160 [Thalassiosira oceanica]|uniref:Aconitase/3-isopropylmalate dehydratase large subunit alpha/beta/alpha domain-containing protein n=1 Tax=Thalassiosira oceanica TaxID=159749 RepID=K3W4H9_THAOC|nr:hypothetical protein THAOC_00160 [Thalassiosira oceanica]|eukprot:EJK77969.1 hypothetical protein THAOC_00160 [Thalassiosira oceanica]